MNKLFIWVNSIRPDVQWIKGDSKENCSWDLSLPNQQEIIDKISLFDESWEPAIVPEIVTPRQFKTAVVMSGIQLSQIDQVINSMQEPDKSIAYIAWEYALEFERTHPLISQIGNSIGLTSKDLDDIFILANSL